MQLYSFKSVTIHFFNDPVCVRGEKITHMLRFKDLVVFNSTNDKAHLTEYRDKDHCVYNDLLFQATGSLIVFWQYDVRFIDYLNDVLKQCSV